MITLDDYWHGYKTRFAADLKPYIEANAKITIERANKLLNSFYAVYAQGLTRTVNSGWRPPAINAQTPGAARNSLHLTGEAVDLSDGDGDLGRWCLSPAGLVALEQIGLWIESPAYTRRWLHAQCRGPKSGNRVFIPG